MQDAIAQARPKSIDLAQRIWVFFALLLLDVQDEINLRPNRSRAPLARVKGNSFCGCAAHSFVELVEQIISAPGALLTQQLSSTEHWHIGQRTSSVASKEKNKSSFLPGDLGIPWCNYTLFSGSHSASGAPYWPRWFEWLLMGVLSARSERH